MNALAAITRATLAKDLRLEWRSKDATNAMLFFALLVVVIFSFSFAPNPEQARQIAGGLVWVAFLFASSMALNQSWARELRHHVLDGYLAERPLNVLFVGGHETQERYDDYVQADLGARHPGLSVPR